MSVDSEVSIKVLVDKKHYYELKKLAEEHKKCTSRDSAVLKVGSGSDPGPSGDNVQPDSIQLSPDCTDSSDQRAKSFPKELVLDKSEPDKQSTSNAKK